MTGWVLTIIDWRREVEMNGSVAIGIVVFSSILTLIFVVITLRTVYKRWRKASTEVFTSQV